MMKTTVTTLTIGSTTNCLTLTNVLTSTVFIVVVSTVPIIVPFGTFMARLTDINQRRDTTIIQGLVIMAMAIGVTNSGSDRGKLGAPVERTLAILRYGLSYEERNWNVPEYDDDGDPRGFGD